MISYHQPRPLRRIGRLTSGELQGSLHQAGIRRIIGAGIIGVAICIRQRRRFPVQVKYRGGRRRRGRHLDQAVKAEVAALRRRVIIVLGKGPTRKNDLMRPVKLGIAVDRPVIQQGDPADPSTPYLWISEVKWNSISGLLVLSVFRNHSLWAR